MENGNDEWIYDKDRAEDKEEDSLEDLGKPIEEGFKPIEERDVNSAYWDWIWNLKGRNGFELTGNEDFDSAYWDWIWGLRGRNDRKR